MLREMDGKVSGQIEREMAGEMDGKISGKPEQKILDEKYMKEALRQAKKAYAIEEVPIGCVIVREGKIIARGYNRRNTDHNVLSHAELNAMKKAVKVTGDWRLEDCTMYITLEPCQMCAGAIVQARVKRVVVGAMNAKAGCAGSVINLLQMKQFNHQVELETGVMEKQCSEILSEFFRNLRTRNGSSGAKKMDSQEISRTGINANSINVNNINANGIDANGISANGIDANGISANGINTNNLNKKETSSTVTKNKTTTGHGRRRREKRMGPFKVLLWDIDGTLLNFLAAEKEALRYCFRKYELGELTDEMIERYSVINKKRWEALEKGLMTKQEVLVGRYEEFFAQEGLDVTKAEAVNAEYQVALGDTCIFCDQGDEIVRRFMGKIGQYAVTNGTLIAQSRKLKNSGLDQMLDGVFISDKIGYEKPSVEFFDAVFAGLQSEINAGKLPQDLKKEEILIIGDSLTSDIRGGNNAGIPTCWYNPAKKPNDKGVHVDFEITDLHQLIPISGVRFR